MGRHLQFSILFVYLCGIYSTTPAKSRGLLTEAWKPCLEGPKEGEFIEIHEVRMNPELCTTYPEKECVLNSQIPQNISVRFTPKINGTRFGAYLTRVVRLNPAAALGAPAAEALLNYFHFFQVEFCDPQFNIKCPYVAGVEQLLKVEQKLPDFPLGKGRHIIRGKIKGDLDKELTCHEVFVVYE